MREKTIRCYNCKHWHECKDDTNEGICDLLETDKITGKNFWCKNWVDILGE